ncbi:FIST C-terminal domain-containing protein [Acidithiobacillus sp. AMEEHan]|uniref:FIST C-terminal domain-containing protein n=1 Tax=Acidithiobacillus sp. AMEEHan TaxID=2994951 RepID=UPI0027E560BE|nr:FIST C-terminal domain-containing protein [Acidithiobacillus sp. AMEEHan]
MAFEKLAGPVSGALIVFSPGHLPQPRVALQRLARRLACLQIRAGSFPGVISDHGSALGRAACAVLLFSSPLGLGEHGSNTLLWAGSQDLNAGELPAEEDATMGVITSKHSWFWQHPQRRPLLRTALLGPLQHQQEISSGISPLTELFPYFRQEGALLLQLERFSALPLLARNIPFALREARRLPLEQLLVAERDAQARIRYLHIVATDSNRSGLWLERPLRANSQVFLAWRNPDAALRDTRVILEATRQRGMPHFAWLSYSSSRAMGFSPPAGDELTLWHEYFPNCPLLGAFAHAELVTNAGGLELHRFGMVMDLFYRQETRDA